MLNTLRAILPIGPEQWEQVVHCHEENWPAQLRDRDSINRKYSTLHRKSIPTGDPNISPAVKLAKEIKHFIGVKANEMSPTQTNPLPTPQLAQYTQLSEYTQLTGATQASTQEPQQSMVTPRQEQRSNKILEFYYTISLLKFASRKHSELLINTQVRAPASIRWIISSPVWRTMYHPKRHQATIGWHRKEIR